MCHTHVLKRWRTKKRSLVKMSLICMGLYVPAFILGYLSVKSWFLFWALIWKASKTMNDIKFCKEAKTIIVVDKWLNSLMCRQQISMVNHSYTVYKSWEIYKLIQSKDKPITFSLSIIGRIGGSEWGRKREIVGE